MLLPWRIAAHIRRSGVDLIHAHQFTCYVYGAMARLVRPVPLVFTEHGRLLPDLPSRSRRLFNRIFFRSVARTVAVSKSVRDSLVRVEDLPRDKIEVIYNGVDLARFSSAGRISAEARRCLGIPPDATVIGTVGRLDPGKNYQLLVSALPSLRDDFRDLRLVVVGDGPERSNLSRLAAQLQVQEICLLLGERHDIEHILPAFTVFALPSLHEGTPLTVLEAMAASVPIVATAVGGIPEILTHGVEALLVEPGVSGSEDQNLVCEFTTALKRLISDAPLRAALAAAALRRVTAHHSLQAVFARYHSIYAEVLGRPS